MIRLSDSDIGGIYLVEKHDVDSLDVLDSRFCSN